MGTASVTLGGLRGDECWKSEVQISISFFFTLKWHQLLLRTPVMAWVYRRTVRRKSAREDSTSPFSRGKCEARDPYWGGGEKKTVYVWDQILLVKIGKYIPGAW